jgi:TRAP-type C4-dicarboxylate transport system substrate-binding protein
LNGRKAIFRFWLVRPNVPVTARALLLATVVVLFALAWRQFRSIPLLVLGQPRSVGLLQQEQEAPFFNNLAGISGLPLSIAYRTADTFGLKDSHQLEALRDGRVDIVSLRFMQNINNEPSLEGLDLPGMIPDFAMGRRVADAYTPVVDRYLQKSFGAKLLGVWSFGPQVMFCRSPLSGLQDIRGRSVRVASPGLAQLLEAIGAIPAILPFEDTRPALAASLVDCAVTSAASANFARWTEHTNYFYPLAFQFGFNGYAVSLRKWNALSAFEQQRLQEAFQVFTERLWSYSQNLQRQSEQCITGGPCSGLESDRLAAVPVASSDVAMLQDLSRRIVLPAWSARCDRKHEGCQQLWNRKVAPIVSFREPSAAQP